MNSIPTSPWRILTQHFRRELIQVVVSGLLVAALNGVFVWLLRRLLKQLESPQWDPIVNLSGEMILVFTILGITRYFHNYWSEALTEKVSHFGRSWIHRLWLEPSELGLELASEARSGKLISQVLYDLQQIQFNLRYLVDFGREWVVLTFMLGWLFYLSPGLTAIILGLLPVLLLIIRRINRWVNQASHESQQKMEQVVQALKENLDGWRLIQAYNAQPAVISRLEEQLDQFLNWRLRRLKVFFLGSPISEWLGVIASLIILLYMARQMELQKASYGDFSTYLASLLLVTRPIKVIQEASGRLQDAKAAFDRLVSTVNAIRPLPKGLGHKPVPRDWEHLSWQDVGLKVKDHWILQNITVKLKRGQLVGVVGPSGGGKSSLVNTLLRFFDVTQGVIQLDQTPIWEFYLQEWRSHISYVAQESYFFSATLWENLKWVNPHLKPADLDDWLQALGLEEWFKQLPQGWQTPLGEGANRLSGGQKQRLSLLRALIKPADIYIFDEPTASLDPELDRRVHELIRDRLKGALVIIVGHRYAHLTLCHRLLWIQQGRLQADDVPSKVLPMLIQKEGQTFFSQV